MVNITINISITITITIIINIFIVIIIPITISSIQQGTLTQNYMNYRKCSINGVLYGTGITEVLRASMKLKGSIVSEDVEFAEEQAKLTTAPHVCFYDPNFDSDREKGGDVRKNIDRFYFYLSLCHEVVPERLIDGSIKLSVPNPDDEALVCAASYFGYEFKDRKGNKAMIYDKTKNEEVDVEVLCTIPFTSKRRRMSVIIRDPGDGGKLKIITKGADIAIYGRLLATELSSSITTSTQAHINQFSTEGLRCLVMGASLIDDEKKFNDWLSRYNIACQDAINIEKRMAGEDCEIDILEELIEKDLHIIGATGIEDKLQDGVPESIEKFLQAGMKVWILTGINDEYYDNNYDDNYDDNYDNDYGVKCWHISMRYAFQSINNYINISILIVCLIIVSLINYFMLNNLYLR